MSPALLRADATVMTTLPLFPHNQHAGAWACLQATVSMKRKYIMTGTEGQLGFHEGQSGFHSVRASQSMNFFASSHSLT